MKMKKIMLQTIKYLTFCFNKMFVNNRQSYVTAYISNTMTSLTQNHQDAWVGCVVYQSVVVIRVPLGHPHQGGVA